jgi:exosortase
VAGLVLGAACLWAYWPTLAEMVRRWSNDPTYSHGYLVPFLAGLLLWSRRGQLTSAACTPSWWGLGLIVLATAARLASAYFTIYSPDRFSLLLVLAGLCVGLGGWQALRWAWPGIAFLFFMIPLPAGADRLLAAPLQRLATLGSTYVLQTMGFVAQAEGNIILLPGGELNVVEACSGLRMFMTFCALSVAVAMLAPRSTLQRVVIAASALPLALVCNIGRITSTGVVQETVGPDAAHVVFHDVAGWLMAVVAALLLLLELKVLSYVFVPVPKAQRLPLVKKKTAPGPMRTASLLS